MIIAYNIGGLANRIKAIASGYRLSEYYNRDMYIRWDVLDNYKTHTHILNCPFYRLFKNRNEINKDDIDHISPDSHIMDKNTSHCLIIFDSDNISPNFNNFNSGCSKQFTKSDKYNRNIDFMYRDIPEILKNKYIQYFKKLEPVDYIRRKIDIFSSNFDEYTISVHIRSWNRNGEGGRREGLYDIIKWEKEMDKYDERYKFFISTDSNDVRDYFMNREKYNGRIILYDRETNLDKSRDFPEGVIEDLIELYLLSKNRIIIGSHFSTYTEVAWYLGGCSDEIVIV